MAKAKKLPSGSWRVQVYDYTDKEGKRHYASFTSDNTSTAGRREAEYLAAEFALNKRQKSKTHDLTLGAAIDRYCSLKSNILSPSTLREYTRMRNNYFDQIVKREIKRITPEMIQEWTNQFAASHSPKTTRNAHGLLSAVLETYAPGIRLSTVLPQKIKPTLYVPSDDDIKALLTYFSHYDVDMEIAVYLAAFGTLRRSEVCALNALDVSDNTINVNKAIVDSGSSDWVLKTTKTISSTRVIELPHFVISRLPTEGNLVRLSPDQVTRRFERALKKIGLTQFRFHDLRHYAASIMHAIGVPDQYIMQRGGWGSDKTLKTIYRGTISSYEKSFTDKTMSHFETMQHEMQHKKINP